MAASLPDFRDEAVAPSAALAADATRHTTDATPPVPAASMNAVVRAPGGEAANSATPVANLALPAVDLAMLRLTQAVCDARFAEAAATLGALRCSATVHDSADAPAGHPAAADPAVLTFTFTTPREPARALRAAVEIDLDDYPALCIALGPAETSARPAGSAAATRHEALVLAVASLLLEPLCARLATLHLHDLRLAGIARGRIGQIYGGPFVHLAFAVPAALAAADEAAPRGSLNGLPNGSPNGASDVRHRHVISLPDSTVDALDALVAARPFTPVIAALAVPGRLVLGVKRLAIDTLAQLQPGDVLLHALFPGFDAHLLTSGEREDLTQAVPDAASNGTASHGAPRAVVAWGTSGMVRLCAAVEFDGLAPVLIKEPYMSEQLDPGFADTGMPIDRADDLIRVSELELPVQFEIDTLAMPLSQLSALGPGYVIEFPVPFNDARLRLVAHGNTIGYGELVTVGDHLGVRIVRMAHKSNPPPGMDDGSI